MPDPRSRQTSAPSVMAALKQATADRHRSVESSIDLTRASSSIAEYRRLLEAFYGFYQPLEVTLREADWSELSFEPIWRSERLRADLQSLDVRSLDDLPTCGELVPTRSIPQLVGTLYVIEGAALGGRIIARTLRDRLGIDAANGGRFFAGDAENVGARWQSFGRAAEAASPDMPETIAAAQRTFAAFENWLRSCSDEMPDHASDHQRDLR